jgi:chlorophyll synthase
MDKRDAPKGESILKHWRELTRPVTWVTSPIGIFCGALAASSVLDSSWYYKTIAAMIISGPVLISGGQMINHYFDMEIDRINKPHRPLPSGKLNPKTVLYLSFIIAAVGIILSFLLSTEFGYFSIIEAFLIYAYSVPPFRFKKHWLGELTSIPLIYGLIPILGGWAIFNPVIPFNLVLVGILISLTISFGYSIKDFEDVEGDAKHGVKTLPVAYGIQAVSQVGSILSVLIGLAYIAIPYLGLVKPGFELDFLVIGVAFAIYMNWLFSNPKMIDIKKHLPPILLLYTLLCYFIGVGWMR